MTEKLQIREYIARAIEAADKERCPDGYADRAGFGDYGWLSDWGAYLADRVVQEIKAAGYTIVPLYRCDTCGRSFDSAIAKQTHRMDKHTPHRKLSAKDRPADLGPILCGYPECNQTFANEWNATQHRRMVHGIDQDHELETNTAGASSSAAK